MSKGGQVVVWGPIIGLPLNAFVFYLLAFAIVSALGLLGVVLIISGIVSILRAGNQ